MSDEIKPCPRCGIYAHADGEFEIALAIGHHPACSEFSAALLKYIEGSSTLRAEVERLRAEVEMLAPIPEEEITPEMKAEAEKLRALMLGTVDKFEKAELLARAEKAEAELAAIRAHMAARPLNVGMADTPCGCEVERREREAFEAAREIDESPEGVILPDTPILSRYPTYDDYQKSRKEREQK